MNYRSDDGSVKTGAKRVSVNVQKKNKKKQDLNVSGYKRLKTYEDNVQPGFICNKIETANLYPSKYKMDRAKGQKMKVVSKIVENHNSMISEEGFSDNMSDSSLFYELSNISQDHNIEFQFNKQKHPTMRRIDSNAWDSSEEPFSSTVLFYPKDSDLINLSKENDYFSTNKFQQQTSTYYFNKHISNPCNKSSSAFYNTKFRNPRFEPASEMLKANCLDSASRFTENLLDKNAGLKGREFKQIYRANRAQISRTIQFDITFPLVDANQQIESEDEDLSYSYNNSNQFLGISSLNSEIQNSDIQNPEEEMYYREMHRSSQQVPVQGDDSLSMQMMNPEDEYEYSSHNFN